MQPINYNLDVKSPFESALQGFQTGIGINQIVQKQQQQELELQQKQQMQTDLADVARNPTPEAIAKVSVKYPQFSEHVKRTFDMMDSVKRDHRLEQASQVFAAANAGRPDIAIGLLRKQAEAARNSGLEEEAKGSELMANLMETSPETATLTAGKILATVMGPDKFMATFSGVGAEKRENELQPSRVRKAEADATTAEAEADVAPQKAKAGLALTETQTDEARKRVQKLGVEIGQLSGNGGLDPDKRFDYEAKLRGEYRDGTKGYQEVKESFNRMSAAEDSGAGDIAMVYSFMKMLDPGSVVREGEFATAENAGGAWNKVGNLYNRVLTGERLTPSQRKTFLGQARALMGAAEKREKTVRSGIENVIKSYRLNPDNVFYDPSTAPQPATATSSSSAAAIPSKYSGKGWTKY